MGNKNGWVGVDLDGTLAYYDGWKGELHIGEPIPAMVVRVQDWLDKDIEVRIFTARVADNTLDDKAIAPIQDIVTAIENWCIKHIGQKLKITNKKDFGMIELWDDRCVQVITNSGIGIGESRI